MTHSIDFIDFISLPTPGVFCGDSTSFNDEKRSWESNPTQEHPLMNFIRQGIINYRMQSAAHFDVIVDVKQAFRIEDTALTCKTKLNVVFANFTGSESWVCRPVFRKHLRKKILVFTDKVEVWDCGSFLPLEEFLAKRFPSFPYAVSIKEMQAWWAMNGKNFNWASLPTELKEHIISFCVHQPLESGHDYRQMLLRYRHRFCSRSSRPDGVYEIVDKLSNWAALLGVSHQIRAITLRLCFTGSNGVAQGNGFGIYTSSPGALGHVLQRLGRYFQMVGSNSMPVDYATQSLADCYKQHPRIYSHLQQYATFRHGIRMIRLEMTFLGYMHFFKVTTGGFGDHLKPESTSYEVFDQLPHLSDIAVKLPGRPARGWSNIRQHGPLLFHDDSPCPRTLHRLIYERILDVLTLYTCVEVQGFIDGFEEARYNELRETAMKNAKWSFTEYKELYRECRGGIKLEESVQPGICATSKKEEQLDPNVTEEAVATTLTEQKGNDFFPPKCRCAEKCHLLVN